MSNSVRKFLTYSICFVLIFNLIFFPQVTTDDTETAYMFVLISIAAILLIAVFYWIFNLLLKNRNTSILVDSLILFLLSELAVFCFLGGEVCLFGIFYKLKFYTDNYADIAVFREQRDFAISISFLISAIATLIIESIFFKKVPVTKTDL